MLFAQCQCCGKTYLASALNQHPRNGYYYCKDCWQPESATPLDPNRLEFARWLYLHRKVNEYPAEPLLEVATGASYHPCP